MAKRQKTGVTHREILDLIRLIMNSAKHPQTMQMFMMVALVSQAQAMVEEAPEDLAQFDLEDLEWIDCANEVLAKVKTAFPDIEDNEHAKKEITTKH